MRDVEFDVPRADFECLRQLPEFKDYDPNAETFAMLTPIYALKGAPWGMEEAIAPGVDPTDVASTALRRAGALLRTCTG